jgi:lysophospholipase L1-like esterase
MKKHYVKIAALCATIITASISFYGASQTTLTIYTIGDSTMSIYDSTKDWRVGWAQQLPKFFNSSVTIVDAASSGRSSKSFITEGKWTVVLNKVTTGDYVFIQFAHNDEKDDTSKHTDPWTTYSANLIKFISETRAKGGIPVLCTPIVRRYFTSATPYTITASGMHNISTGDSIGNYPKAMRSVAAQYNVPLIDLTLKTKELVESYGPDSSKKIYNYIAAGVTSLYPDGNTDDTHLNAFGATKVAGLAIIGLQELNSPLTIYLLSTTAIKNASAESSPISFALVQNYPNPFNPSTVISYSLPVQSPVTLKVYTILGKEVATLVNEPKAAGTYTALFNASQLSSGIYFAKLTTNQFSSVRKMVLMK